jgi:hypothetical protein
MDDGSWMMGDQPPKNEDLVVVFDTKNDELPSRWEPNKSAYRYRKDPDTKDWYTCPIVIVDHKKQKKRDKGLSFTGLIKSVTG